MHESQISFDTGQVLVPPPSETLLSHREILLLPPNQLLRLGVTRLSLGFLGLGRISVLCQTGQNKFGHILDNCEMDL